jgi:hypothetical protein
MPDIHFFIEKNDRSVKTTKPHIVSFPEKREASKVKKSWAPTFAVVMVIKVSTRSGNKIFDIFGSLRFYLDGISFTSMSRFSPE